MLIADAECLESNIGCNKNIGRLQETIRSLSTILKVAQVLRSPYLSRALLQHRVLAAVEHRRVLAPDLATIIDVGANRGQFALAARHWSPRARVISFEPLPGPAALFRRVFAGDPLITLHQSALGTSRATLTMHISARDDSSSLLPISATQSSIFPGTAEVGSLKVPVAPLSDFVQANELRSPAMIKLDVQGYEYDALLGCESVLPCVQWIYCECSFLELYTGQKLAPEVISLLAQRGFQLVGIQNPCWDPAGRSVQADLLFARSS